MSVSKHLQDKLALLPDSPGCYIMKDENQIYCMWVRQKY